MFLIILKHTYRKKILTLTLISIALKPVLSFSSWHIHNRYPVGYNPDLRTRPNYYPSGLSDVNEESDCVEKVKNIPQNETLELKPRPVWKPPVGYDPKSRRLQNVKPGTENLDFTNPPVQISNDGRKMLCTGIWMGNTILKKQCVYLE